MPATRLTGGGVVRGARGERVARVRLRCQSFSSCKEDVCRREESLPGLHVARERCGARRCFEKSRCWEEGPLSDSESAERHHGGTL